MKVCWNLTNICNLDCTYCFRELQENALSLDKNLIILKKLYNAGVTHITFAGGEPLLYPNLEELLKEGQKMGIKMSLITNGSILSFINYDNYLSYLEKITISIDSPSEYVNTRIGRGTKSYQILKDVIKRIHEDYPNLEIVINTVVSKETINEVDYMFQEISNELVFYGIKKWKISRFIPLRGHAIINKNYFDLEDEDFNKVKESYENQNAEFKIDVRDKDSFEKKFIISPGGNIKKTTNLVENVILDDIYDKEEKVIARVLGGRHV